MDNSDSKKMIPIDGVSNNNTTEKNNESNLINNNTDNISDIPISNNVKNDDINNVDNIDNIDEKDMPKFPSMDKDKINGDSDINQDNNNELDKEENSENDN